MYLTQSSVEGKSSWRKEEGESIRVFLPQYLLQHDRLPPVCLSTRDDGVKSAEEEEEKRQGRGPEGTCTYGE